QTIAGTRFQTGDIRTQSRQTNPSDLQPYFPDPPDPASAQDVRTDFRRFSAYAYHLWQIDDALQVIGGLSYDRLTFPANFAEAPVSGKTEQRDQFSPKAGMILTPGE